MRWDSLGEYLATAIGFQELGQRTDNAKSVLLGDTLMSAVGKWLDNSRSPGRKVKQIDNRGSNFYVALYWAEELAAKDAAWAPLAKALKDNEEQIVKVSSTEFEIPIDINLIIYNLKSFLCRSLLIVKDLLSMLGATTRLIP